MAFTRNLFFPLSSSCINLGELTSYVMHVAITMCKVSELLWTAVTISLQIPIWQFLYFNQSLSLMEQLYVPLHLLIRDKSSLEKFVI